jgi:hypothetical protein
LLLADMSRILQQEVADFGQAAFGSELKEADIRRH